MVSEAIFLDNMGRNISRSEADQGGSVKPGVGCFGGRRPVKNTSIWLSKWGRLAVSDRATFSDFVGSDNENVSENRNSLKTSHQIQRLLSNYSMTTLLQDEFSLSTRWCFSLCVHSFERYPTLIYWKSWWIYIDVFWWIGFIWIILILTEVFIIRPNKITEGGMFWHGRSSPFW